MVCDSDQSKGRRRVNTPQFNHLNSLYKQHYNASSAVYILWIPQSYQFQQKYYVCNLQ